MWNAHGTKAGFILSRRNNRLASVLPLWERSCGACSRPQLRRAGHSVTVYEKNDRVGGLLRYGIPNFKLEKHVIDRRIEQMSAEGVQFITNAHVGVNVPVDQLMSQYEAVLLTGGV